MVHLCSGRDQSGPREVPNSSPTIATSPWECAAGTPSMAGLRAHRASMMVFKTSQSIMQSGMASRLIGFYLRVNSSVPWKYDAVVMCADDFEAWDHQQC